MSEFNDAKDFKTLVGYLNTIQAEKFQDTSKLNSLLASCWEQFSGGDAESMVGNKLYGRMESVVWEPPVLTFTIERHGQTVQGSTRAGLHQWCVNIETKSADITNKGHRQLHPMQPRLDVKPLAEQVAELILNKQIDEKIKWNDNGSVKVLIGKIIPEGSAARETVAGRRKRFREALNGIITVQGWEVVRANVYNPPDD